jgi:hypothetical protein
MPDIEGLQNATPPVKRLNKPGRPRGMDNTPFIVDPVDFDAFKAMPIPRKGAYLREEFAQVSYLVLKRAKQFAPSVSKIDFGKLTMLMSSAGIAYDKVVPKGESLGVAIQVNLFKGLPLPSVGSVLGSDSAAAAPQQGMDTGEEKS